MIPCSEITEVHWLLRGARRVGPAQRTLTPSVSVFQLGGKEVHVETWKTSWPLSYIYKQQGVEVKVNPDSHWWCVWLCDTTDDVDRISCTARLLAVLESDAIVDATCSRCRDLTVKSGASWGSRLPGCINAQTSKERLSSMGRRMGSKGRFSTPRHADAGGRSCWARAPPSDRLNPACLRNFSAATSLRQRGAMRCVRDPHAVVAKLSRLTAAGAGSHRPHAVLAIA
jgi:hypothetical protein